MFYEAHGITWEKLYAVIPTLELYEGYNCVLMVLSNDA